MTQAKPACFIAMPVSTSTEDAERFGDPEHWEHVRETLFVPAIEAAGYRPIRPVMSGAALIHANIIRHLQDSEMVLCDLSSHNPNVFFELGVRTALNRPIALVRDEHTTLPFDTSGINTALYRSTMHGWETPEDVRHLTGHVASSAQSCEGNNPLWQAFGLTLQATEASAASDPEQARMDLLLREVANIKETLEHRSVSETPQSRHAHEFAPLHPGSSAPGLLASFVQDASVFRTESDAELHWFFTLDDPTTAFIKNDDYEAIPLASRRALQDLAAKGRVAIARLP